MGYDPTQPYRADQPSQSYGQSPTSYNQPPEYGQVSPSYGQPPTSYDPPTGYEQVPPPYGQQPPEYTGMPPMPNYGPPQKKSLRWLWITLAVVGGLLVLVCGGCAVASFAGIGYFAKTIADPTIVTTAYYQNIKDGNYDQAYANLDTSNITVQNQPVTQTLFKQVAQAKDNLQGQVTNFSQANISTASNNGVNTATVTMLVTREQGSPYNVQLQLQEENGTWKITDFDNI